MDENDDLPIAPPRLIRSYAVRECSCGKYFHKSYKSYYCNDCVIRRIIQKHTFTKRLNFRIKKKKVQILSDLINERPLDIIIGFL